MVEQNRLLCTDEPEEYCMQLQALVPHTCNYHNYSNHENSGMTFMYIG